MDIQTTLDMWLTVVTYDGWNEMKGSIPPFTIQTTSQKLKAFLDSDITLKDLFTIFFY